MDIFIKRTYTPTPTYDLRRRPSTPNYNTRAFKENRVIRAALLISPTSASSDDSSDGVTHCDYSDDDQSQVKMTTTPHTRVGSSMPKLTLTFHTATTEDVELYQVFKGPLQWLDRDLDIFREFRFSGFSGNSHKDCYSHNTLDIPALAVILHLKDCVSHGGINRLQQAQEYFTKPPWKLHHSEWVCGNEENSIQYYVLTLDRPLYSVKRASTERIRIMRYVTHKRWSDSVQLYQFLLGIQPAILKRDFCLFSLEKFQDYDVQFALKRLPRGIVPKKTRKTEMSISVEDIGSLVALLPHTCYRITESRWCTRDLDGNKIFLDVTKHTTRRSRSVSPSKLQASMKYKFSVSTKHKEGLLEEQHALGSHKLAPGVYNTLYRSQSVRDGINQVEELVQQEAEKKNPKLSVSSDFGNGASWSKLTQYERYITTPAGGLYLCPEADVSLDSPDSGVFTGTDNANESELYNSVNKSEASAVAKSWLEGYIAKISQKRKHQAKKKKQTETSLISDTTSCDEEVDRVINPSTSGSGRVFSPSGHLSSQLSHSASKQKVKSSLRPPSTLQPCKSNHVDAGRASQPMTTNGLPGKSGYFPLRPASCTEFTYPRAFTSVSRNQRVLDSSIGEGDSCGIDDNSYDKHVEVLQHLAKGQTSLASRQTSTECDSVFEDCNYEQDEQIKIGGTITTKESHKEPHKEPHKTNGSLPPSRETDSDDAENNRHSLFNSVLLRKGLLREFNQNGVVTPITATKSITPGGEGDDCSELSDDQQGRSILEKFRGKDTDVSNFLLKLDLGNKDLPDVVRSNTSIHDACIDREGGPEDCSQSSPVLKVPGGRKVRFSDSHSTHVYDAESEEDESSHNVRSQNIPLPLNNHKTVNFTPAFPNELAPATYTMDDWSRLKRNPAVGFYI